jgi:hypothetical protein
VGATESSEELRLVRSLRRVILMSNNILGLTR